MSEKQETTDKQHAQALGEIIAGRINNPVPIKEIDRQALLFENLKDCIAKQQEKSPKFDAESADYAFALLCKGGMSKIEAYCKTHPKSKTNNKETLYVAASRLYNSAKIKPILQYLDEQARAKALISADELYGRMYKELDHADANVRLRAQRMLGEVLGVFKTIHEVRASATRDGSLSELDSFFSQKAGGGKNGADARVGKK